MTARRRGRAGRDHGVERRPIAGCNPERKLRALINYEIYQDDAGKHDHKLYLWVQARFRLVTA